MATAGKAPCWRRTSAATTADVQGEGGRAIARWRQRRRWWRQRRRRHGGRDNDNDGSDDSDDSDDNDNGGSDNDNDGSDNNDNGGNRGDGGGGCDTATAVGIDKEDNNQLKVAMDNGRGGPEAAVES